MIREIIMTSKPAKSPNKIKSCRSISLLSIISRLFEKLVLKQIKPIICRKKIVPAHHVFFEMDTK